MDMDTFSTFEVGNILRLNSRDLLDVVIVYGRFIRVCPYLPSIRACPLIDESSKFWMIYKGNLNNMYV